MTSAYPQIIRIVRVYYTTAVSESQGEDRQAARVVIFYRN